MSSEVTIHGYVVLEPQHAAAAREIFSSSSRDQTKFDTSLFFPYDGPQPVDGTTMISFARRYKKEIGWTCHVIQVAFESCLSRTRSTAAFLCVYDDELAESIVCQYFFGSLNLEDPERWHRVSLDTIEKPAEQFC